MNFTSLIFIHNYFIRNIISGLLLESQIVGSRNNLFSNCQQQTQYINGRYRVNLALSRALFSCDTTHIRLASILKTFFINVSFHILGASLTLMALF